MTVRTPSAIWTVVSIVVAQMGLVCASLSHGASATVDQPTKLILGFEDTELRRGRNVSPVPARPNVTDGAWFRLWEGGEARSLSFHPATENGILRWTWHCRPGEHTEGTLALASPIGPPELANVRDVAETYERTQFLSHFYPQIAWDAEATLLMTTFSWLPRARPELRDWSGYDRLWIDVRCDVAGAKIWLALEDDLIEPPVVRTYEMPAQQWVTLELDLQEAQRVRDLDLTKITTFWLMGKAPSKGSVRIDNVRIALEDVRPPQRLLRDDSAMTVPRKLPKRPETPPLRAAVKRERTPVELAPPSVVARGSIVPFGWVSAYDNRFIFVAYTDTAMDRARAVYSDDAGQSWKQLPDPQAGNLDHGSARGCAIDQRGDGAALSGGAASCDHGNCRHAGPRQHLTKYTFTGDGWEARLPAVIMDSDTRRCTASGSVIRLGSGPYRGRLWSAWGQLGRKYLHEVHAKFSDDDGRTWHTWGKGGLLPGSRSSESMLQTMTEDKDSPESVFPTMIEDTNSPKLCYIYSYPQPVITPYKDHVACFWRHQRGCGVIWSVYDGRTWSAPSEISPVTLDDMHPQYQDSMSAVTQGDREIFFTATGMDTVLRFDGRSWRAEGLQIEDGGMLSLAGDVVTLFTSGRVNRDWNEKGVKGVGGPTRRGRQTTLRYYRRRASGEWDGPIQLTPEIPLHQYKSLAGFTVPPYSPPNFVPLAYSDRKERTVKLLRVPIPQAR